MFQSWLRQLHAQPPQTRAQFIADSLHSIHTRELHSLTSSSSSSDCADALLKLLTLALEGVWDIAHADVRVQVSILQLMASSRGRVGKRLAYLASMSAFPPLSSSSTSRSSGVLRMGVNGMRKDLLHPHPAVVSLVLSALPLLMCPEVAVELHAAVLSRVVASSSAKGDELVAKKAVLVIPALVEADPSLVAACLSRLRACLVSTSPPAPRSAAVTCSCVAVMVELMPAHSLLILPLAPVLFRLLLPASSSSSSSSTSNSSGADSVWMRIKLVRLFRMLARVESRLIGKLRPVLFQLVASTSSVSLLFECMSTLFLLSLSSDGASASDEIRQCIARLSRLLGHRDLNIRFAALQCLQDLACVSPVSVSSDSDLMRSLLSILDSTDSSGVRDESLLRRSVGVLLLVADGPSLPRIVDALVSCLGSWPSSWLLSRILDVVSFRHWERVRDFKWMVGVVVRLVGAYGDIWPGELGVPGLFADLALRVPDLREYLSGELLLVVVDDSLLVKASGAVIKDILWVLGEYCVGDVSTLVDNLKILVSQTTGRVNVKCACLHAVMKLWMRSIVADKIVAAGFIDAVACQGILEVEDLVSFYRSLLESVNQNESVLDSVEARIVAHGAQKAVRPPDNLELDNWIGEEWTTVLKSESHPRVSLLPPSTKNLHEPKDDYLDINSIPMVKLEIPDAPLFVAHEFESTSDDELEELLPSTSAQTISQTYNIDATEGDMPG